MCHDTGQRHFEQLWRDGDVDVWVISWANGNDTGFHDHDVSCGAVAVVEGEVIEERLALGGAPRRLRHRAGETFDFDAVARAPDAAGQRHPGRDDPRLLAAAVADGGYVIGVDGTLRRQSISYAEELRPSRRRRDRGLIVIGGGVMGLFTAYNAAAGGARVVVLERGRIGDPMTASYGRTRSFRNDYLRRDVRALRARGVPAVGRLRARHGRAGARALRLHEHRPSVR